MSVVVRCTRRRRSPTGRAERSTGRNVECQIPSIAQYRNHLSQLYTHRRSARRARSGAARHRDRFDEVECFCLFLGFPRSGSSLMGQLINAHRHAVISHESNVVRFISAGGMVRAEVFGLILENDRGFVKGGTRGAGGYQFAVPGQWQGKVERLRVIGDKKAAATATLLGREPALLDRVREVVGVPVRIVCPVRNPFDNIATIAQRSEVDLARAARVYFRLADRVSDAETATHDGELLRVRHEDLVADVPGQLARMCEFLDLDAPPDYLAAAASIVFASPRHTRDSAPWTPELIDEVQMGIDAVDFLTGYSFDS